MEFIKYIMMKPGETAVLHCFHKVAYLALQVYLFYKLFFFFILIMDNDGKHSNKCRDDFI